MIVKKITYGFVVQEFDEETEKFVSQEFVAGDQVEHEDEDGNQVDDLTASSIPYLEFDMVQPVYEERRIK